MTAEDCRKIVEYLRSDHPPFMGGNYTVWLLAEHTQGIFWWEVADGLEAMERTRHGG